MEFRGRKLEVEGCGDGITDMESMHIRCPNENARAAFFNFSNLRLGFKKARLKAQRSQDPCG